MKSQIEDIILRELCTNFSYRQRVLPYIKSEYFSTLESKLIVDTINDFIKKYKQNSINFNIISVELEKKELTEGLFKNVNEYVNKIKDLEPSTNEEWLLEQTDKFCRDRAIYDALQKSIDIYEKNKQDLGGVGIIPTILEDALKVSLNSSLGHDYLEDAEEAFDRYVNNDGIHIPFNLKYFDMITNGGILRKTLNICIAGTGGGKSLMMCSCAANYLMQNLNVLYLTGEMDEFEIRRRIDSNLMDIDVNAIKAMSRTVFMQKHTKISEKTTGRLIIKEFEEGGATTALHFASWIDELKTKQNFTPDVIIVDYLTLVGSYRVKLSQGSYTIGKAVAEEVRALGKKYNAAILTGAQFNRSGMDNSDPNLSNTSESVGIPFTADLIFAIISSEEMNKSGQKCIKQMKNRYNDENYYRKFIVGCDKSKMRFFDVDASQQNIIDKIDDAQIEGPVITTDDTSGLLPFN